LVKALNPENVPASPCIGICTIDKETRSCIGCYRTLEEIGTWRKMTLKEKRSVVENCTKRLKLSTSN
jgi:hypothetical protein